MSSILTLPSLRITIPSSKRETKKMTKLIHKKYHKRTLKYGKTKEMTTMIQYPVRNQQKAPNVTRMFVKQMKQCNVSHA